MVAWLRDPRSAPARPRRALAAAVLALSALLVLPFHLSFDPARARDRRSCEEGRGFAGWLRDELLLFGSLAGSSRSPTWAGCWRRGGRRRNAAWIAVAALFAGSLLAAVDVRARRAAASRCWSRCGRCSSAAPPAARGSCGCSSRGGVACLLGPELLYVRDEFDGGAARTA